MNMTSAVQRRIQTISPGSQAAGASSAAKSDSAETSQKKTAAPNGVFPRIRTSKIVVKAAHPLKTVRDWQQGSHRRITPLRHHGTLPPGIGGPAAATSLELITLFPESSGCRWLARGPRPASRIAPVARKGDDSRVAATAATNRGINEDTTLHPADRLRGHFGRRSSGGRAQPVAGRRTTPEAGISPVGRNCSEAYPGALSCQASDTQGAIHTCRKT